MILELTALRFDGIRIGILDQTALPQKEVWVEIENPMQMVAAIQKLQVRGAPMIGVAASLSLAQAAVKGASSQDLNHYLRLLNESRPTAVNLMNCMSRMKKVLDQSTDTRDLLKEAINIAKEDIDLCERIARHGENLIEDGDGVITHCNTGSLATAGIGTAFGIIRKAHESGKKIHVYVDETRPLLQGGRLTAWECEKFGIPYTLICDNMAGFLMAQGKIQKAFVGSDRVAINGDFANKIGTYSLAVLSHYHKVEFYMAAPFTTYDAKCANGSAIPIEERNASEIRGASGSFGDVVWAPKDAQVYNPSFDVTPAHLVTGWVFDKGLFKGRLTI